MLVLRCTNVEAFFADVLCLLQDLLILDRLGKSGVKNYMPIWRKIYLVHGDNVFSELSAEAHITDINRLLNAGK